MDPSAPIVRNMLEQGWLEASGERWRLSQKGWPVADAVAREFLRLRDEPTPAPKACVAGP
jgi:coproporphyrinogen III oxidase-like Fe-S oxidoreductase